MWALRSNWRFTSRNSSATAPERLAVSISPWAAKVAGSIVCVAADGTMRRCGTAGRRALGAGVDAAGALSGVAWDVSVGGIGSRDGAGASLTRAGCRSEEARRERVGDASINGPSPACPGSIRRSWLLKSKR